MPYKPPLHIIQKEKTASPDKTVKLPSRESKISNWTLSYRIKGMALGLIVVWLYNYFFLNNWPEVTLIIGAIAGWILGLLVGRFFYRD